MTFDLSWDGEVKERIIEEVRQAEQRKKQLLTAVVVLPVIFWLLFSSSIGLQVTETATERPINVHLMEHLEEVSVISERYGWTQCD